MDYHQIPVHVKLDGAEWRKFLVPKTMTTSDFSNILRKRLRFAAVVFKIDTERMPDDDTTMDELYRSHAPSFLEFLEVSVHKYSAAINI